MTIDNVEICKYFIDRESILFDFILEDDKLGKVLELLEEEPLYLTMILTPGKKKKTPLDQAIENNSPKVVELFLKSLLKLSDFKLSTAFQHQFGELFDMGVDAFRLYLNLCYFSTEQMKLMKRIKTGGSEEKERYASVSSILGEKLTKNFYTNKSEEKREIKDDGEKNFDDSSNEINEKDSETLVSDVAIIDDIQEEEELEQKESQGKELRVEVKAVEFDWVLSQKQGGPFLDKLRRTKNLAYFEIEVIKDVILFQWKYFLPRIILFLLIPFLAFFILFILYTTWILDEKFNEGSDGDWNDASMIVGI